MALVAICLDLSVLIPVPHSYQSLSITHLRYVCPTHPVGV